MQTWLALMQCAIIARTNLLLIATNKMSKPFFYLLCFAFVCLVPQENKPFFTHECFQSNKQANKQVNKFAHFLQIC